MRKTHFRVLVAIATLFLAALACNFSASTANITDGYMAADEGGTQRVTVFAPNDTIYAIVQMKNAPDDTVLKAVWTGVDLASGEKNTTLAEKELTTGGSQAYFSLTGTKPVGKYKVDIFLNGELNRTLDFEVQAAQEAAPPPNTAAEMIKDVFLSLDEAGEQPSTVFGPTDTIYAIVDMPDAPADTVTKAVWYLVEAPGYESNSMIDQASITSSGVLTFNLTPTNPFPAGKYKVEFYVNNELVKTLEFEIQG
jgi:hypothetical protein